MRTKRIRVVNKMSERIRIVDKMNDYIDRQAAIDALNALCVRECKYSKKTRLVMCSSCELGGAFEVLDDFPSADVEPVVRCKDCKHRCGDYCHNDDGFAHFDHFFVHLDDYCSRGERMDGGEANEV